MDEDDQISDQADNGPAMGPIYMMWECTLEKLKILDYEKDYLSKGTKTAFSRVHFAIPSNNLATQFNDFISICAWLINLCNVKEPFKVDSFEDPTSSINKLLLALRTLDFRGSFPAQKLKIPHGESVCTILDFLADKALSTRNFKFETPIYKNQEEMEEGGDDDSDDEEILDEEDGTFEEDTPFDEVSRLEGSLDPSHKICVAQADPAKWGAELEVVAPRLKVLPSDLSITNDWRSHVDQTISSKNVIDSIFSASQNDLTQINKNVKEELSQIQMKEKYLNNIYNNLCEEYIKTKNKHELLEEKIGSTNEEVSKLNTELAEISEKLDDLKESFDSKDNGFNDTSPIVKLKAAFQNIKDEIHALDMKIGVVSQSLIEARVIDHNNSRKSAHLKAKQRQGREIDEDDY